MNTATKKTIKETWELISQLDENSPSWINIPELKKEWGRIKPKELDLSKAEEKIKNLELELHRLFIITRSVVSLDLNNVSNPPKWLKI